ncbi:hypothetical protein GCM10027418_07150 [Mariniluteicoccus endophyticus]
MPRTCLWNRLALILAALALLTAQSVSTACPASACSCMPPDPERAARSAAYVAKVRVDRVTQVGGQYAVFSVDPEALYKGPGLEPTTIVTNQATTACGLGRWKEGTVAMIVGYPTRGDTAGIAPLQATWCSLMTEEEAQRVLGPPRTQALPNPAPRGPNVVLIAAIGLGVVTLVGLIVGFLVVRRRRPGKN